ncbi:hypothetical protein HYX08_00045 [Candidatus Woesearchaeota archaeon]|nr:hypothetical protein [Candidatus Woesearchaeota archaeon]
MDRKNREIGNSLLKEEINLLKSLQSDRDLIYGFILGILVSLLATIFYDEFIKGLQKNVRYSAEFLILIMFFIILVPFVKRYSHKKRFLNDIKGVREELYFKR